MAFYASNVVSAPVIGLVWTWMLNGQYGLINHYFHLHISWLTSTNLGLGRDLHGDDLVGLRADLHPLPGRAAGDQTARSSKRRALTARAGGASLFRIFIPLLRRTFVLAITLELISTFQIFSQVNVMTAGGPANSTASVLQYLYTYGVTQQQLGYASALGVMLFVLIVVVALIFRRFMPERGW